MKLTELFKTKKTINTDELKAGTGFMICLSDTIRELQQRGYSENLVPQFDHLTCHSGEIILKPKDFFIDEIIRFENSSDPADQSILYAVTCEVQDIKGLYVESYGFYHDELSSAMLERIKYCRQNQKTQSTYEGKVCNSPQANIKSGPQKNNEQSPPTIS